MKQFQTTTEPRFPIDIFQTIVKQSPISTQIFTPDGMTIMVNKSWEKLWGIKASDIIGYYNVLQDDQLVEKKIMPFIKKAFAGEIVQIPAIKYEPDNTVPGLSHITYRWVKAVMYPIVKNKKITYVVLQHEDITSQKEAEERLQESEAKFRKLFDANIIGVFISHFNGLFLDANDALLSIIGYTRGDLEEGKIHRDKLTASGYDYLSTQAINSMLEKGISATYEKQYIRKDGKQVPVLIAVARIDDTDICIGFVLDMTERYRTEEAKYRLAALVESSDDAIVSKNLNSIIQSWNYGAEQIFGYKAHEAIGKSITMIIPPDLQKEETEIIRKIRRGERISHFETTRLRKDGKRITVSLTISPVKNDKGEIIGASKIARDITEQKKYEQTLRISEERLRIALNAGNIGVWDWDLVQDTLTWTEHVYAIHGVKKESFTPSIDTFSRLIHPDDKKSVLHEIDASLTKRKPLNFEFRIITPRGDMRWVSTHAVIITSKKGKPIRMLGATSEITRQKQLEQEKSDFLSMASHELKTPITSMKMFIELLARQVEGENAERPKYFIKRIKDQADRLSELTNDLLDVSRIETGKLRLQKESFDIAALITDTVESIALSAQSHEIVVNAPVTYIYADRYRIYQVIINLLTNAIKYSPHGKEIIITVLKNSTDVTISVQDFGIGIKKDDQKRIFDRLFQATDPVEKTYPGLGLGLYIAKEIVERHNGRMWVESQKGKGSTFYFSLPEKKAS